MSAIEIPGVTLGLDESAYHSDPVPGGSLSYSGMKHLLKSPAHYRHHMDTPRVEKKVFDEGHIIHALVLGQPLNVAELPFSDYRTKAAQLARDEAYTSGLIPVKSGELDPLREVAEAVLAHGPARELFETDLPAEVSLFATDSRTGVNLRGRVDKLAQVDGQTALVDLKTCTDSDPAEFRKDIARFRYYLQSTVYTNLWHWLHLDDPYPEMVFVAVSKTKPHLVTLHKTDWVFEDLGQRHMNLAIDRYKHGIQTGEWPGFEPITYQQTPPAWMVYEDDNEEEVEVA